ncbi:UNVERIFIED_ORG: UPF0271 protein [Gordonia westfalica J30]
MTLSIDLNADAGESFGRWKLGNDEELFDVVSTVNIACGYHAGDPVNMRKAVVGARDADCAIGAHPGYPDLLGFGRRAIPAKLTDTVDYVLYQVGALAAIAADEGVTLSHVKPHGSLMGTTVRDAELAVAMARAIQSVQTGIPLVMSPGPAMDAVVRAGLPVTPENAADLDFDDNGFNVIEPVPAEKDPEAVATRALQMAHGSVETVSGATIAMPVTSICIHGDRPNAVAVAAAVRRRLESEGVAVRPVERRAGLPA